MLRTLSTLFTVGGLAMPQPELQLLHVLIGDVVEALLAERREQVVLEHQFLVRDATGLGLVRAHMAVHEPWRELL